MKTALEQALEAVARLRGDPSLETEAGRLPVLRCRRTLIRFRRLHRRKNSTTNSSAGIIRKADGSSLSKRICDR